MPSQRLFSTGDAARILNLTRPTVDNWINSGFVDPLRRGLHGGDRHVLDESALFALAMGRACRLRGTTLAVAGVVMKFCASVGFEKIRTEIAAGRRFLIVLGGSVNTTADVLFTQADALGPLSPKVRKLIGPFVPVIPVDLGEDFDAFEKEVAALVEERESKRAGAGAK
jgi:hypothetical protein